jgi:hypothetical protein
MAGLALPIVAVLLFAVFVSGVLANAGDTLGYDFLAYHAAAVRVLDGEPLYDMSFAATGGFGLFYYPPQFLPLVLPFGLLEAGTAVRAWMVVLFIAFGVGVAILPVSRSVRWWIVLLAGVSWPFVFAIKLGQVGPILFLAFAVGWRWLDAPVRSGIAAALGTAIKLQPAILFVWALLTRRWGMVVIGVLGLVLLSVAATVLAGVAAWSDFLTLIRRVADPIATDRNLTPGAVAWQLGVDAGTAGVIQLASTVVVVVVVVLAAWRATAEAAFLVAVVASQLLSPILWDHYAMLLLLPVAWLCAAGHWWAVLVPLSTATILTGITPPIVYPLGFFVILFGTLVVGWRSRANDPLVIRGIGIDAS